MLARTEEDEDTINKMEITRDVYCEPNKTLLPKKIGWTSVCKRAISSETIASPLICVYDVLVCCWLLKKRSPQSSRGEEVQ